MTPEKIVNKKGVHLFSSFATDTLVNSDGVIISVQAGGPALFLRDALQDSGTSFELVADAPIDVEILITPEGEFGRIPQHVTPREIHTDGFNWTIVSTLVDEWHIPADLPDTKIAVDIQGYVRDGTNFSAKKVWHEADKLVGKISCVKGTKEEIQYLPARFLEAQKQQILVITNGENGIELFHQGAHTHLSVPSRVDKLPNTIGAGDTFLGYFVAALCRGDLPTQAALYAMTKTTRFLERKKSLK